MRYLYECKNCIWHHGIQASEEIESGLTVECSMYNSIAKHFNWDSGEEGPKQPETSACEDDFYTVLNCPNDR